MLVAILTFVIILGLLVFVHEFGHFIAAKKFGIKVEEFGFGFPPRLFGIKRGETIYSINWIPLGGFVKIKGEQGDDRGSRDSFSVQPAWKKSVVLCAGVLMNFVLAFALYTGGLTIGLPQTLSDEEAADLKLDKAAVIISQTMENSPATAANLRIGDQIVKVGGQSVYTITETKQILSQPKTEPITMEIRRGTQQFEVTVTAKNLIENEPPMIGLGLSRLGVVRYNLFEAIWRGLQVTISMMVAIVLAFAWLIKGLVLTGSIGADVAGPLGVAVMTNQVVNLGWTYVVTFMAALSINLGIINILPFPALDGGRLIFVLAEKIKGRPASPKLEGLVNNLGFSLLLLLMVFITYHDVLRYGSRIWLGITSFFF